MNPSQEKIAVIGLGCAGLPGDEFVTPPNPYNLSPEVLERAAQMCSQMDAIRNAPLPPDDELPRLPAKYQDRMDAMEFRAQVRLEQGRPV